MITKDYDGSKITPKICEKEKTIRVTKEYIDKLRGSVTISDIDILRANKVGEAICPEMFWFNDTLEVRRILKVK